MVTHGYIPAVQGMTLSDIDTPALLVELDTLEGNLDIMAHYCRDNAISLRPHAKTHKAVDIARLQVERGAVGICCQKVSEAEVFVKAGIDDVLVSNQVVGAQKIARLVRLAELGKITVCADHLGNISALNEAASSHDVTIDVLVELDIGGGRCGASSPELAIALASSIAASSHLRFAGLQAYHGQAQHVKEYEKRKATIERGTARLKTTLERLNARGLKCKTVTGAGTGSYPFETASGLYTELQCGSYVFMDADYNSVRLSHATLAELFSNSLFVLSTVMSVAPSGSAVCDAGLKAHSVDSGLPLIKDPRAVSFIQASDEHGLIADPDNALVLGEKLLLIPGHCDPTVNLYDWLIGIRNGSVEAIWPVSARGMVY